MQYTLYFVLLININSLIALLSAFFLGYSPSHLGYRCLDKTSGKIYIAHHVTFDEKKFSFKQLASTCTLSDALPVNLPNLPWLQVNHLLPVDHRISPSLGMSSTYHTPILSTPHCSKKVQPNHTSSNISSSTSISSHDSNLF